MAKESRAQKKTIERVMHEFKHGELESRGGREVKNRKQAVAIALNEAGASKYESPKENQRQLRKTKEKERKGETGRDEYEGRGAGKRTGEKTKSDLYAQAKKRNIPGRSKMDKVELERALRK
jgi:hypothetical protein